MGILNEFFPPKPKWNVEDIPDLTGKVIIVTGGSSGIGKATAKALLSHNAKVYIATRSRARAEAAIRELMQETGKEALFLELDLASLKSVKQAASDFQSKETQLHVLFNNGGVMLTPINDVTADGYDQQFGVNVLGHFYFTKLLIPTLLATAESTGSDVRVVTTSSLGHSFSPALDFDALRDGPQRRKLGTQNLYHFSKLGNTIFAHELARRYGDRGVVSTSLNPGNVKTNLIRHASTLWQTIVKLFLYSADMGALTQLYAGTAPEASSLNGKYLMPWARVGEARADTLDPELGQRLWQWLEEQVANV